MIVKLNELKKFLNITNTDQDVTLYDCLVRAHTEAEVYCDRAFELAMRTEYYKANADQCSLNLRSYPIVESGVYSLVIYDDIDLDFGADTLLAATEYQVDHVFGQVHLTGSYFEVSPNPNVRNIKVVYGAGYDSDTIPNDLRLAIMKIAGADFQNANTYLNAVRQSTDTEGEKIDMRAQAFDILDSYKRWR